MLDSEKNIFCSYTSVEPYTGINILRLELHVQHDIRQNIYSLLLNNMKNKLRHI